MKDRNNYFFIAILLLLGACTGKQIAGTGKKDPTENRGYIRILFYNVENYFDSRDDSLTLDEEFTSEGDRHWTFEKYKTKQKNIYKVIAAAGEWELPEIIGLCEIENQTVLLDLIQSTPLKWKSYSLIHKESPDRRGIDVGLLYRTDKIKYLSEKFYKIRFPEDTSRRTRDILYFKCLTDKDDTLHIFVNHWPSRLGGQQESEASRNFVAGVLKSATDSIFRYDQNANIIIGGDFNDEPDNFSITDILKAGHDYENSTPGQLYNLSWFVKVKKGKGSNKYQGDWSLIDQIIVSGSMLMKNSTVYTSPENAIVFDAEFLSEPDESFVGVKPFRTFVGFKYNGGFSDHYPVYLDIFHK